MGGWLQIWRTHLSGMEQRSSDLLIRLIFRWKKAHLSLSLFHRTLLAFKIKERLHPPIYPCLIYRPSATRRLALRLVHLLRRQKGLLRLLSRLDPWPCQHRTCPAILTRKGVCRSEGSD